MNFLCLVIDFLFCQCSRFKMFSYACRYTNPIVDIATCDAFKVGIDRIPSLCDGRTAVFIFKGSHSFFPAEDAIGRFLWDDKLMIAI